MSDDLSLLTQMRTAAAPATTKTYGNYSDNPFTDYRMTDHPFHRSFLQPSLSAPIRIDDKINHLIFFSRFTNDITYFIYFSFPRLTFKTRIISMINDRFFFLLVTINHKFSISGPISVFNGPSLTYYLYYSLISISVKCER